MIERYNMSVPLRLCKLFWNNLIHFFFDTYKATFFNQLISLERVRGRFVSTLLYHLRYAPSKQHVYAPSNNVVNYVFYNSRPSHYNYEIIIFILVNIIRYKLVHIRIFIIFSFPVEIGNSTSATQD